MRLSGAAVLVGVAGFCMTAFVWAQSQSPVGKPAAPGAANTSRPWDVDAEDWVHNDHTRKGEFRRVVVTTDEGTVIRADLFTYDDALKAAQATGNLSIADKDLDGAAARADVEYARSRKVIALSGPVHAVIKPRADPAGEKPTARPGESADLETERASVRRNPINVDCDRLVYAYARDKKHATLSGNLRAVQKLEGNERILTAASAEWFGLEDRLVLKAPVRFEDKKGRKGESDEDVEIGTREGHESLHMRKGKFQLPMDDDEPATAAPPQKPGGRG